MIVICIRIISSVTISTESARFSGEKCMAGANPFPRESPEFGWSQSRVLGPIPRNSAGGECPVGALKYPVDPGENGAGKTRENGAPDAAGNGVDRAGRAMREGRFLNREWTRMNANFLIDVAGVFSRSDAER